MRSSAVKKKELNWPSVWGEDPTINYVIAGYSIARFGDGEFNLLFGGKCATQSPSKEIAKRLKDVLLNPGRCLIGIPRIEIGPKRDFWMKFVRPEISELFKGDFVSAFITRPDSAPWIDRFDYWDKIKRIWFQKDVVLVRGSDKSLTKSELNGASSVEEIIVPKRNAFADYNSIMKKIIKAKRKTVILCCGPTATIMAHDLCNNKDFHAIDLGHLGMFLKKHRAGKPMTVTKEDKLVDRL